MGFHLVAHSGEKAHKCTQCEYSAGTKPAPRHYLLTHSSESLHECKQCTKSFSRAERVEKHIIHNDERQHKKRNSLKRRKKQALGSNFLSHCAYMRACYVAIYSVKVQIRGFTLSLTLGRNHLHAHNVTIHPEQNQPWESTYSLTVEAGPQVSMMQQIIQPIWKSENSPYRSHRRKHINANDATIWLQQKQQWELGHHMSLHSGEKPHDCTQCNFATAPRKALGFHMRIHMGENPYKCIKWNYLIKTKQALKYHLLWDACVSQFGYLKYLPWQKHALFIIVGFYNQQHLHAPQMDMD